METFNSNSKPNLKPDFISQSNVIPTFIWSVEMMFQKKSIPNFSTELSEILSWKVIIGNRNKVYFAVEGIHE